MADIRSTPTAPPTPLPRGAKPSITPANGRPGKWDTIQLGIRLGCVVLLTAAVVGFFCLSGKAITVEQIVLIVVAGAALAGISIARPGGTGGTGTTLLGGGMMMLMLMGCAGCGVTQAQVAVQTSLTGLAEGVHAADGALVAAMPRIQERAIECARDRCGYATCADATTYIGECLSRADAAVDGLEVAAEALRVAQVAQDAWVASGDLPDADPLCDALGDAVAPLVGLLDEAGVEVPPGIAGAGAVVEVICGVVARWAAPSTVEVSHGE
ncbi:MAG: hypothetical protein WC554_11735 [Clostridia bacterium]